MTEITKSTTPARNLYHGQVTVSTTPVKLCEKFETNKGVLLRAPGRNDPTPNTQPVWVGGLHVTPQSGMPIVPGAALVLPVDDPGQLYVISTTSDQLIAYMGI